jgi:pyruvate formate lyase activating enzyme
MRASASPIRVGGFEGVSLCDWPGEIVATVFCQGCPWDCAYCHNPHLIPAHGGTIAWDEICTSLKRRVGLLDGVVFSGGEPTLQSGLEDAIKSVRDLGFRVALHTAGPYPSRLRSVLPLVDWVGFDIKASFADFDVVTRVAGSGVRARKSLDILIESGVAFELRTTLYPPVFNSASIDRLVADIGPDLAVKHKFQEFRDQGVRKG